MDVEFVNAYIERLVKEVEELTKTRLLNEARLKYMESVNTKLLQQIQDLEKQVEKQNKKKAKEVNTSVDEF
jgi:phage-related minor tail protein